MFVRSVSWFALHPSTAVVFFVCQCVGNLNVDVDVDTRECVYHPKIRLSLFSSTSLSLLFHLTYDFLNLILRMYTFTTWVCVLANLTYMYIYIPVVYRATAHFCVVVLLNGGHDGRMTMCGEGELVNTRGPHCCCCCCRRRRTAATLSPTVLPPRPI